MANEPNGEPVIAIDSDEEGEHAKFADVEATGVAWASAALQAHPNAHFCTHSQKALAFLLVNHGSYW